VTRPAHIIYLCHVVDEKTKHKRSISSDSPAATKKVFAISNALRAAGLGCSVLSSGRGRQNFTGSFYSASSKRHQGVATVYAHFVHLPVVTHLVTMLSLALIVYSLLRRYPGARILAYNRSYHYVAALIVAKLFRSSIYLDLEDGYNNQSRSAITHIKNGLTKWAFDRLCNAGAVLAATTLGSQVSSRHTLVCYGVAASRSGQCQDWSAPRLRILFGGTLLEEVGSQLLIDALALLIASEPKDAVPIEVIVTGKGPWEAPFFQFARNNSQLLKFAQNLPASEYAQVLRSCHVGLSLRLSTFQMGATTFPSKVLEYADNGLLVVSTRSSDVPALMGDTVIYLEDESAEALVMLIRDLVERRDQLKSIALAGQDRVHRLCSPTAVGKALIDFFDGHQ
jgi:hypothetical protein